MKNTNFLLLIVLVLSSFCKKENQLDNLGSPEQVLTDGAWTQAQYLEDQDGDGIFIDESAPCELDNTWIFDGNDVKSMTFNDIGELCASDIGPITIDGFWELKNNNQVLNVYLAHGSIQDDYTISLMNDSLLVLHLIDQDDPTAATRQKLVLRR